MRVRREVERRFRAYLATVERAHDGRRHWLEIPADLSIPAFLRRAEVDGGEEYRLAWAEIEGFCE